MSTTEPAEWTAIGWSEDDRHVQIDPSILYFGTPVALISTVDLQGKPNLMPMSSVFWLGHTAMLGVGTRSQTSQNLRDTGECVINLPSVDLVSAVDSLALTTGRDPVPDGKADVGYEYVADKYARAGLTPEASELVVPDRAAECPVAMEGRVTDVYDLEKPDPVAAGGTIAVEVRIVGVHVHPAICMPGHRNRIDPDRWRPLIMSFQRFYGLSGEVHPSRLSSIDEEWYG